MASVWIVEKGEYSDRNIRGVFSSEEKAKEFVAIYWTPDKTKMQEYASAYDITEYELDKESSHPGEFPYKVILCEEGASIQPGFGRRGGISPGASARRMDSDPGWEHIRAYGWASHGDERCTDEESRILITECWARDEEHAIKIAADRRAEFLARRAARRLMGDG